MHLAVGTYLYWYPKRRTLNRGHHNDHDLDQVHVTSLSHKATCEFNYNQDCNSTNLISATMDPSVPPSFSCLSQELIDKIIDYYFILGDSLKNYREHEIAIKACSVISCAFHNCSQNTYSLTFSFLWTTNPKLTWRRLRGSMTSFRRTHSWCHTFGSLGCGSRIAVTYGIHASRTIISWNLWLICCRVASDNSHHTWS